MKPPSSESGPFSLHPIPYREALRDLLQVKPETKPQKPKAKRKLSVLKKAKESKRRS